MTNTANRRAGLSQHQTAGNDIDPGLCRLLIVEDDADLLKILQTSFTRAGYQVEATSSAQESLTMVEKEKIDLILTDFQMPGLNGLELLTEIKKTQPDLPVIIITAYGTIRMAVEAMRRGAFDYITKPFHMEELKIIVARALQYNKVVQENILLRQALSGETGIEGLFGNAPSFREVINLASKVAPTNATVMITGESGTGKELLARAIHSLSPRASGPFVAINCASIPDTLLESELFGHRKGSFTGAVGDKTGRFEAANKGTLFLDEIAEIKYELQAKLLRAIQEKAVTRIGDNKSTPVDTRIISATNQDLTDAAQTGRFREDLYYRLSVVPLHLPPLRERREDIPLLVNHILSRLSPDQELTVAPEIMQRFMEYRWPGNIRELENVLERMVILRNSNNLTVKDLPPVFSKTGSTFKDLPDPLTGWTLQEAEKQIILNALTKSNWNKSKAARELGIPRHILIYRLKKHEISPPP